MDKSIEQDNGNELNGSIEEEENKADHKQHEIDQDEPVLDDIHQDEFGKKFSCDMCKNVFMKMSLLELHISEAHLKKSKTSNENNTNFEKFRIYHNG